MNCDDVCRILFETPAPSRLPEDVLKHLKECPRCLDTARALDPSRLEDAPTTAQLRQIEQTLLRELRPVRPLPPASYLFAVMAAIFAAAVIAGAWWLGTAGLAAMSTLQAAVVLSVFTVSAITLAYSLVQRMAPGGMQTVPARPLPIAIVAALTVVITLLFSFHTQEDFWTRAWSCIRPGMTIATLSAAPLWLVLRRGANLSPAWTGAAAGLLAGLAGAAALEIYCPNLNAWHILAAHIGTAALSAAAGFLIGVFVERQSADR